MGYPPNGELVTKLEDVRTVELDAFAGQQALFQFGNITAYDESIQKYLAIEGTAYLTAHSMVVLTPDEYVPISFLTFYFYTRSQALGKQSPMIRFSNDPDMQSQRDYIIDKITFLVDHCPAKSLLLIDGPLIGGDVYTFMMRSVNSFLEKQIVPVFFVKNTSSNVVTETTS